MAYLCEFLRVVLLYVICTLFSFQILGIHSRQSSNTTALMKELLSFFSQKRPNIITGDINLKLNENFNFTQNLRSTYNKNKESRTDWFTCINAAPVEINISTHIKVHTLDSPISDHRPILFEISKLHLVVNNCSHLFQVNCV